MTSTIATLVSLLSVCSLSHAAAVPVEERATCTTTGISASRAQQVQAAFSSSGVVPVVVPSIDPTSDLEGDYNGKAIDLGNVFSTAETLTPPSITFTPEANYDPTTTNYTFIFVDPDAAGPQDPILRFFLHALVYNAHPSCVSGPVLSQPGTAGSDAVALAPYLSLTPLSVANHRYTQLVYRQPEGEFKPQLQISEAARALFDLGSFVEAGNLELVGGNFFYEGLGSLGSVG